MYKWFTYTKNCLPRAKTLNLIFLFITFFSGLYSQGGFKRKYYFPESKHNVSYDAFESPNGEYIITGLILDTTISDYHFILCVTGTDLNGKIKWTKKYPSGSSEYLDSWQNGTTTVCESKMFYQVLSVRDTTTNKIHFSFVRFDYQGNLLGQSFFNAGSANALYPFSLKRSVDGGFLIAGFNLDSTESGFLIKSSELGIESWRKVLPKDKLMRAFDVIQDPVSKCIIMAGFQDKKVGNGSTRYGALLFLDSIGTYLNEQTLSKNTMSTHSLLRLSDGNFLASAQWIIHYYSNIYQGSLIKFNAQGKIIWHKKYLPVGFINSTGTTVEKENGDIVALCRLDKSYDSTGLQLFKFDASGNLKYQLYQGKKTDMMSFDSYSGINKTSDGGYLLASRNIFQTPPTPFGLIKIDSLGCDSTETYCKMVLMDVNESNQQQQFFEIYPNPADGHVVIKLLNGTSSKKVALYDIQGELIFEVKVASSEESIVVDLSGVSPGIYFCSVTFVNGGSVVKKVVVSR